ncbi:MAG: 2-amino-4-hydroxy-6-hydroxymethyldihydropteridine diphosphokinase [Vicinamibacteria bacterium]|nr:2-amino-4-hydroxy-6-hydroxymethyldihydropteridine diphosphokinase [Vicinamibacteria bacterium]
MTPAFIGVGSNIDPERNVMAALRLLGERARICAISTFYRTIPLGAPGTPAFVNGVVRIETAVTARALKFGVLRAIEASLGRNRTGDKHAPRPIDLDVLIHGETVLREPDLVVPDPEILARPFLAVPLAELAPDLVLPDSGRRLCDVAERMNREGMTPLTERTRRLRAEIIIRMDAPLLDPVERNAS